MKRLLPICLLFALLLSACGRSGSGADPASAAAQEPVQIEQSYRALPVELPLELARPQAIALYGDRLYVSGRASGSICLYALDTVSGEWNRLEAELSQSAFASVQGLAATEDTLFLLYSDMDPTDFTGSTHLTAVNLEVGQTAGDYVLEDLADSFASSILAAEGRVLVTPKEEDVIYIYSVEGERINQIQASGTVRFVSRAGETVLVCTDRDGGRDLFSLDVAQGTLKELCPVELPADQSYYSEAGCFLSDDDAVYTLNTDTGLAEELFDWQDSGASLALGMDGFVHSAAGDFYVADSFAGLLWKISPCEGGPRTVLTLGVCAGANGTYLNTAVSLFNAASDAYVVRIENYNSEDKDRVLAEIGAGKGPDILAIGGDTMSPYSRALVSTNILVDMLPYLDADETVSREDFVPGVLEGMLQKGGLYNLAPCFSFSTLTAPKALADSPDSWTVDTLFELNANLPENTALFSSYRREFFMEELYALASVCYVDYENGACSFDDASFARWLELVNSLVFEADAGGLYTGSLLNVGYTNPRQTAMFKQSYGDYAFLGFPGPEGPVSYTVANMGGFSILSTSPNKEAAWDFIRLILSDTVQKSLRVFGSPVMKALYEAELEENLTDENAGFTREDAERLKAAVAASSGMARGSLVSDMIREEAEKYFAGQSTLENAVAMIQSRAKIYLAEQQ